MASLILRIFEKESRREVIITPSRLLNSDSKCCSGFTHHHQLQFPMDEKEKQTLVNILKQQFIFIELLIYSGIPLFELGKFIQISL